MKTQKLNILVLYSCSEFPFRKTFQAFLNSFQKYSEHNFTYINYPYLYPKAFLSRSEWDVIIFTHSFTGPWNRTRYRNKIDTLKNLRLNSQIKIAFFQDEYINTDLTCSFINELEIDKVYTVAPASEWKKIYPNVDVSKISPYLTGYIEEDDIKLADRFLKSESKDIDVSYRTAYPGNSMASFGEIGWLKYAISEFGKKLNFKNEDIKVGEGFVTGDDWYKLLAKSKFVLGVPSGANVLDTDGSISIQSKSFQFKDYNELKDLYLKHGIKQDLGLEVVSPRNFESGLFNCIQILVEGFYNGILKPDLHYIPVKRDLSNIQEVRLKISDETYCKSIIKNFRKDIIENTDLRYSAFIHHLFTGISVRPKHGQLTLSVNSGKWISLLLFRLHMKIKKIL